MIERVGVSEFGKRQRDLIAAFEPANPWVRRERLEGILSGLRRLTYFQVVKSDVTTHFVPMVEVRGRFAVVRRIAELVKIDLETIVRESLPTGTRGAVSYEDGPDGFAMKAALVTDGVVLTAFVAADAVR